MGAEAVGAARVTGRGVVRAVVAELAPDEVPALDEMLRFDDARVRRWMTDRRRRKGLVGFGLDEVGLLLSPLVWMALDEALRKVVGKGIDEGSRGVAGVFRRLLRRRRPQGDAGESAAALPPLNAKQLAQIAVDVAQAARRRGESEERAARIAELVVEQLDRSRSGREE